MNSLTDDRVRSFTFGGIIIMACPHCCRRRLSHADRQEQQQQGQIEVDWSRDWPSAIRTAADQMHSLLLLIMLIGRVQMLLARPRRVYLCSRANEEGDKKRDDGINRDELFLSPSSSSCLSLSLRLTHLSVRPSRRGKKFHLLVSIFLFVRDANLMHLEQNVFMRPSTDDPYPFAIYFFTFLWWLLVILSDPQMSSAIVFK